MAPNPMEPPNGPKKAAVLAPAFLTLALSVFVAYASYLFVNHSERATYIIQAGHVPGLIVVGGTALLLSCAFVLAIILLKFPRFPFLVSIAPIHLLMLAGAFGAFIVNLKAVTALSVNDVERPVFARLGAEMLSTAYAAALIPAVCVAALGLIIIALGALRIYSISSHFELNKDTQYRLKVIGVIAALWLCLRFVIAGTTGVVAILPTALVGLHLIVIGMLAFDGVSSTDPNREVAKRSLTIAVASYATVLLSTEIAIRIDGLRALLIAASGTPEGSSEGNVDLSVLTNTVVKSAANVQSSTYLPILVVLGFSVAITLILRSSGKPRKGKPFTVGAFVVIPPILIALGLQGILSRTLTSTLNQLRDPVATANLPVIAESGTASLCKTQPLFNIASEELKRFDGKTFQGSSLDTPGGCKRALDFGDNFEMADRVTGNSRGYSPSFAITSGLPVRRTKCLIAAIIDKKKRLRSRMDGTTEEYWRHPEIEIRVSLGSRNETFAKPFEALGQVGTCLNLAVPLAKELIDSEGFYRNNHPKPEEVGNIHLSASAWTLSQHDGKVISITGEPTVRAKQLNSALSSLKELRMTIDDDVPIDQLTLVGSLAAALSNGRAVLEL